MWDCSTQAKKLMDLEVEAGEKMLCTVCDQLSPFMITR